MPTLTKRSQYRPVRSGNVARCAHLALRESFVCEETNPLEGGLSNTETTGPRENKSRAYERTKPFGNHAPAANRSHPRSISKSTRCERTKPFGTMLQQQTGVAPTESANPPALREQSHSKNDGNTTARLAPRWRPVCLMGGFVRFDGPQGRRTGTFLAPSGVGLGGCAGLYLSALGPSWKSSFRDSRWRDHAISPTIAAAGATRWMRWRRF